MLIFGVGLSTDTTDYGLRGCQIREGSLNNKITQ